MARMVVGRLERIKDIELPRRTRPKSELQGPIAIYEVE
jgi:hypothetical protein